jgi:hypothetical protein
LAFGASILLLAAAFAADDGGELAPRGEALPANPRGPFREGERLIVIGLPMSGKTTLAAELTKDCPRLAFITTMQDDARMFKALPIPAETFLDDPKQFVGRARFRVAVVMDAGAEAEQLAAILHVMRAAGDCVVVLDEVGDYKQKAELELVKLARNGRHNGIVSVYISQMAVDIPKGVRRLATRVYSFQQYHPHDIDALDEIYGEDFAIAVRNSRGHDFQYWDLTTVGAKPTQERAES